jgi:hypothetical protein
MEALMQYLRTKEGEPWHFLEDQALQNEDSESEQIKDIKERRD